MLSLFQSAPYKKIRSIFLVLLGQTHTNNKTNIFNITNKNVSSFDANSYLLKDKETSSDIKLRLGLGK